MRPQADAWTSEGEGVRANHERITVASARCACPADRDGLCARIGAGAAPKVAVARPTGVGRAISTYTIPIEGRDEWLAAARRLA